jgi:Uma2 family endonuclease
VERAGERELAVMNESALVTLKFRPGLRLTHRAFWKLCVANPDLRLERTAQGELEIMSPAGADSGRCNAGLTGQLWAWNQTRRLGVTFDSSAGFRLPNGATRFPDATWITRDRWDALKPKQKKKFPPICPDFVAELRSPSDGRESLREKMREYLGEGVRLGWLIDPEEGEVEIHRPDRPVEVLIRPATLSGEDVLPGFVLDLKDILFD